MKVKEIMTSDAKVCAPTNSLAEVARLMWEDDCGMLPVINSDGKVGGVITDRDVCMAAFTKGQRLFEIAVEDVISARDTFTCNGEDDILSALETMQVNQVRRLPVIKEDGILEGVLSMNDVVLNAEESKDKKKADLSYSDVVNAYKSICEHRVPTRVKAMARG